MIAADHQLRTNQQHAGKTRESDTVSQTLGRRHVSCSQQRYRHDRRVSFTPLENYTACSREESRARTRLSPGQGPSNGQSGLATLYDISGDYRMTAHVALGASYGYAGSQAVTQTIYSTGNSAQFDYVELLLRF